jgi:hypothetical protein
MSLRDLVKRAKWTDVGEYLYTWDEAPASDIYDSEIADAEKVLRARDLRTETDDVGVLVVERATE